MLKDKDYYFGSTATKKIFPDAYNANIGFEFGGISNAFWDMGVSGVMIEGLLFGLFVAWIQNCFRRLIKYDVFFLFLNLIFFCIPVVLYR